LESTIRYSIERKKTEETLRRVNEQLETVNEELEDRVRERTKELIRKNEAMMEEVIQRQRVEQELAEVQRRLLDRVEAERFELAQELHDGPIQELYGLTYQLSFLKQQIGPTGSDKRKSQLPSGTTTKSHPITPRSQPGSCVHRHLPLLAWKRQSAPMLINFSKNSPSLNVQL
jgi:nitrate/nitrite-specific signal transduction histidine kinase